MSTCNSRVRAERGFTLVELMVVVVIIGVLMGAALLMMDGTKYAGTPQGFADKISAEIETTQLRALSSQRWQRLVVYADAVEHWEANAPGLARPEPDDDFDNDWQLVRTVLAPGNVEITALATRAHQDEGDGPPAPGTRLGEWFDFAPDGGLFENGASVFIRDRDDRRRFRVIVYRATGTAYVYEGW